MGQKEDSLEDLAHERAIWKVQHCGWAVFGLILAAALVGVFGDGPISHAKTGKLNSQLWVEYDRLARYQAASSLKVHLGGASPAVWLGRDFVDRIEIEEIYPAPERVKVAEDRLTYVFDAASNENLMITFQFKPNGYGAARARLGLMDGPELRFRQFVYP